MTHIPPGTATTAQIVLMVRQYKGAKILGLDTYLWAQSFQEMIVNRMRGFNV